MDETVESFEGNYVQSLFTHLDTYWVISIAKGINMQVYKIKNILISIQIVSTGIDVIRFNYKTGGELIKETKGFISLVERSRDLKCLSVLTGYFSPNHAVEC